MRLRSDIFAAALIRRAETQGAVAMLRRRGAAEAGALFIKLDRLDGRAAVYGPAPQSEETPEGVDRLFSKVHKGDWVEPAEAEARLKREIMFDPDLWIVEIEDREGRVFVDLAA
ncbi:DUF1491 family protein [Methylocystis sp. JAN1]|uniref:DUF1491 family protein n=1 Tax=Methylocystis sp. JAN1 TaxID=3397211 RepID=UPI003FA282D7